LNNQLKNMYTKEIKKLLDYDFNKQNFSYPFLINVPDKFIEAENKIMVLGQETHGWCGSLNDFNISDIESTMTKYESTFQKRILSREKSKGKSCFIHRLVKISNRVNKIDNTKIIWNNLLKVDYNGKSSKKYKFIVDMSIEILKKELELLKPNILLCQTGTQYDFILKKIFPDRNNLRLEPRKLWKFTYLNLTIYRINHPCARVKGGIKKYYNECIKDIQSTLLN